MTKKKSNMFLDELKVKNKPSRAEFENAKSVKRYEYKPRKDVKPINIGGDFTPPVEAEAAPFEESVFSGFKPQENSTNEGLNIPDELIIAGMPLLVSAMMGQPGVGAGVGGRALVDREQQKQKMRLAEAKKSGGSQDGIKEYYDEETGQYKYGKVSDLEGKVSPKTEDTLKSYREKRKASDEVLRGRYTDLGKLDKGSELNFEQTKKAKNLEKAYTAKTKGNLEEKRLLESAVTALNSDTNLGDRIGIMSLIKRIEQRMSDQDRAYYTGQPSVFAELHAKLSRTKTNREYKKLVNEARKLVNMSIKSADKFDNKIKSDFTNVARRQGLPEGYVNDAMFSIYSVDSAEERRPKTVVVAKGDHELEIPISDIEDAKKDGYYAK